MDHAPYRLFANKSHGIAAIVAALAALAISLGLGLERDNGDLIIQPLWPQRLSRSVQAELMVVVSQSDRYWNPEPVPGAAVTLFQVDHTPDAGRSVAEDIAADRLRQLAAGRTDANGQTMLPLPTAQVHDEADAKAVQPAGAPGIRIRGSDGRAELALRIEHDGEERWFWHSYAPPTAAALALTTDRPLYQPGQTIRMRVLAVDPDTGAPRTGTLRWEIRDPRTNLVLQEESITSEHGVAHVDFALSPDCLQGSYTLTAHLDNAQVTRTVDVRPFRLPRFEVTVVPAQARLAPRSEVRGHVEARFTYGDPVADAEVELAIAYTRGHGMAGAETLRGKTDARGQLRFAWALPPDTGAGSVTLSAMVTSATGRAERGQATVAVVAPQLGVEILAAGTGMSWSLGKPNDGFVLVSNEAGEPVANATVELIVPEQNEERRFSLTTDAQGRASFSFVPTYAASEARVKVTAPDGRSLSQRIPLALSGISLVLELATPRIHAGESLGFALRDMPSDVTVVAANRGYPIGGVRVRRGPNDSAEAALTLDARAHGLTILSVYDARGQHLTSVPVWVAQQGSQAVSMQLDQEIYTPGSEAVLTLGFPAAGNRAETSAGKPGEIFGLVGVDEALYALAERVDLPLSVLLRHEPDMAQAAAAALQATAELDTTSSDHADELGQRIRVARFVRTMQPYLGRHTMQAYDHIELTREVRELSLLRYRTAWALVLGLGFLVLGFVSVRATWRPLTKKDFSPGRVLALAGIMLASSVAAGILAAWSAEVLLGALLVWALVVVCWIAATAVRQSQLPLALWSWTVLGLMLLAVDLAVTMAHGPALPDSVETALLFLFGAPAVLLVIEIALWAVMLLARRLYQPSFGAISLIGVVLGVAMLGLFMIGGAAKSPDEAWVSRAAAPMVAQSASATEEEAPMEPALKQDGDEGKNRAQAASSAGGDASGPRVRSYFPETMVWLPELVADADGKAVARFAVPDSITTWRLNALAHTADGRFGEGQAPLRVWQPFFVELELPTHLTQGDTIEVPIALVNNREQPVSARVTLAATGGLRVVGTAPGTVNIAPRSRASLGVTIQATQSGTGALTVTAAPAGQAGDGQAGDAIERSVIIAPDGRTVTVSKSGLVDAQAGQAGHGWRAVVTIPAESLPATAAARATVYPSVVADALDGLDSMLRRPMGCFEQASSATYPNVLVMQTLESTPGERWPGGEKKWLEARIQARVLLALGYQKILSYQQHDGGFALYPKSESDILLSAYGLMQLGAMHEVMAVDMAVMRRVASYLAMRQNPSGSWPAYARHVGGGTGHGNDPGQVRATSFVAWALASSPVASEHEHAISRALDHVLANLEAVDAPDALAFAANALLAGKRAEAAGQLLDRLAALARRDGDIAYWPATQRTWMGGMGIYADIEATALAAHALLGAGRHVELLGPVLRYLAAQRSYHGGWGTTQATVWTLRTMNKLRSRSDQPVDLTLSMDGQALTADRASPGAAAGTVRIEPGDLLMHTFRPAALGAGEHVFAFDASAASAAMLQVTASYAVPWTSRLARVQGERLGLAVRPDRDAVRRGAALWLTVDVSNPLADEHGATIIELPVPPAAYVDAEQFELLEQSGVIDRFEVLPTHVRLYLAGMAGEQTRTFRYVVRPLVRGTVSLPAARAYVFYVPDPITEVDSGNIRVE